MTYPKLINIVEKVAAATEQGSIEWKETEEEGIYQVSFSENAVRIGERSSQQTDMTEYYLSIFNSDGDLVENIGDEDGSDQHERAHLYRVLRETYEIARRQAKGVDQVLNDIMSDLDLKLLQ